MKKFVVLFMAVLLTLGTVGCGKKAVEPTYASDEKFDIGMWVGVSDKIVTYNDSGEAIGERLMTETEFLAKYQDIADSGVTIAFPGYDVMHDGGEYNFKALKASKQVGIKQIIADGRLKNTLLQAKTLVDTEAKTEEEVVQMVKDIIKPYTECEGNEALYGFMIQDEPDASKFDMLGYAQKVFNKAAPDLCFYVNLFPVVAGGAQLSGTASPIPYDTYLSQYFNKIKTDYISYDHYPLLGNGVTTSIEPSFLYNMDVIQSKIKQEGKDRDFWTFLQSIQYGANHRALTSKADATFQAMSFLAYGGDGIQWFCYASPPAHDGATSFGDNALVTRNYEKTETYNYVQACNQEIQALMPYYKNFDWKGVVISNVWDDTENFSYLDGSEFLMTSTETLKSFTSVEDAFTGVFEDKDGREGYMVVNFTDPALKKANTVTMTFNGANNAIVVKGGVKTVEKLKKGVLNLNLKEGEGAFVIPF